MFVADLLTQYMTSPECSREEVHHFAALIAALQAGSRNMGALEVEAVRPREWTQWRFYVAQGGWAVGGGISSGWSRNYINCQIRRIRKAFRWAALNDLCSKEVWERFCLIQPLRPGQITQARETVPVGAVEWEHVVAIQPFCHAMLWDMVCVHWFTGMRQNELVRLNTTDILSSPDADVWLYCPLRHKTAHRGKTKTIVIGPKASEILKRYMPGTGDKGYLFTTPRGKLLSPDAYRMAVERRIRKAHVPYWHTHQLRHARAQLVDRQMGREAAAALLGDTITVTDIYARRNLDLAIEAAKRNG